MTVFDLTALKGARTIALDLEGTLVSNAVSCFPRPGLRRFVEACIASVAEVVVFTTVPEERARPILESLDAEGLLPPGWASAVRIVWPGSGGSKKDLGLVGDPATTVLFDDQAEAVAVPGQEARIILVPEFVSPYTDSDDVLVCLTQAIREVTTKPSTDASTADRMDKTLEEADPDGYAKAAPRDIIDAWARGDIPVDRAMKLIGSESHLEFLMTCRSSGVFDDLPGWDEDVPEWVVEGRRTGNIDNANLVVTLLIDNDRAWAAERLTTLLGRPVQGEAVERLFPVMRQAKKVALIVRFDGRVYALRGEYWPGDDLLVSSEWLAEMAKRQRREAVDADERNAKQLIWEADAAERAVELMAKMEYDDGQ